MAVSIKPPTGITRYLDDFWLSSCNVQSMVYFNINFPELYNNNNIYLKDIITEEVGSKSCMALMRKILVSLIENPENPIIKIMSQVYIPNK